jgi:SAM-dependent methyltransferase
MLSKEERDSTIQRYLDRFEKHGVDPLTVNPGKGDKQEIQHSIHAEIGPLDGYSLLDIGCGLAHYYEHLKKRGVRTEYVGYDIVQEFIESNQKRHPEAEFHVRDALVEGIAHQTDYVVMGQVFNLRYESADNETMMKKALALSFDSARIGVSIDMLSSYVNFEEDYLCYFSPEKVLQYAKSLTRFVTLRHDYLRFDFTLYLYKEGTGARVLSERRPS